MKIDWKKLGLNLLYPHWIVILCLLPVSVVLLVYALVKLTPESILAILSYLLSFYVLLTICFRVPNFIKILKNFKNENKYMQKWFSDVHLRVNVSLYSSIVWNFIFAVFQLVLGFFYKSFWFYSMFAYYLLLSIMRYFLFSHTKTHKTNEEGVTELKKSILCGWLLLIMNLTLGGIVFFIVYLNKTFNHHMITTIAMAAFTFFTFTFAIINLIKYKKYKSPVYSTAKIISLIAASVSMLTLETTMLTTFSGSESPLFRQIMLSLTGLAVIAFAVTMAILVIVKGTKQLKKLTPND